MFGMEIPEMIFCKALQASHSSISHEVLNSHLQKLETKTIEEFLNREKDKDFVSIDNDIRQLVNESSCFTSNNEQEKIEIIAKIIYTSRSYLQKGLINSDVRSILIFLSVNCYLQIDIGKYLSNEELDEKATIQVAEKILKILMSINLTTHVPSDAPYHEKKLFNESTEGFANNNIDKTYRMIVAIERNGRGFHFNFLLEHLLYFLVSTNFTCFVKVLLSLGNPTDFVFYLQSFKMDDLLKIANENTLTNEWLNFEIIRQIIEKELKDRFEEPEINAIQNTLLRIRNKNFDFFKQTVIYFNRSSLFNASIGELLISFNNTDLKEIFTGCLSIDKSNSLLHQRGILWEHFAKNSSEEQQFFLLTAVFEKWKHFLENIINSEDFYQNEILLTDYANYVVNYYTRITEESELILLILNLNQKIQFIDSEWTISESKQLTKFHLYLSQFYLLSYAYRNKKLNDTLILNSFAELKRNTILLHRYLKENTKHQFKIMDDNFNWLSPKSQSHNISNSK